MGNSLRCCLACILPCGELDLIRVVHLNGYVDELTGHVTAGEVLKDYPNHVLTKPCGSQGMGRRILIMTHESELKRGSIYFLIPASEKKKKKKSRKIPKEKLSTSSEKKCEERSSSLRRQDRSWCTVESWRPYLNSISEDL